ncbi:MAG TPA: hypothetical protein PK402_06530, partial [Tepidisphaeraceae bacterium]|nr:hypothetical protein [Tepidisphaeraceae bacterium]
MRRVRQIIACERFEVRINLDGFGYTLENGTLVVSGTEADESIIAKALDTDLQFSSGSDSFAVPIADVARIEIRALGGTDQIFVESTSGIETSIFGGAGNDVIGFGNTNGNLDTAHGLMHVFGDDGSDNVQCWDNLNPESENFIITNESFTRAGGPEVTYTSDIESLEFMTGLGSDSVNILQLGNLRLRLDSAGGTETVNLGGAFGLSEILNEVVIDNNTSITNVNINDTGNGAPREIIVSTVSGYETIEGLGLGQISVARSNSGAISLTSGLGADVVRIKQTSKTLNINNSAGADTVIIGDDSTPGAGLNNINSDIAVQNFSNLTTLVLTDALSNNAASATWDVDGIDSVVTGLSATGSIRYRMSDIFLATVYASAFNDSFTFNNTTGHLKVLGNNGHDTLTFVGTDATALVEINAGAGNDVLNINADNTGIANVTQLGSDTVQSVAIGTGGKLKLDDAQTALFVNSANINGVLDVGNGAF